MIFYLKLSEDNIIMDIIEYAYEGYVEVFITQEQLPLPAGINARWYRWDGTRYVLVDALKQVSDDAEKARRIEENADIITEAIDEYTLQLVQEGLL